MRKFINRETEAAYAAVLDEWEDPRAMAAQWEEMGQGSVADLLALRLKEDFYEDYGKGIEDDQLVTVFIKAGLRKICFQQIAERLIERYGTESQERAAKEDQAESEQGGELV